MKKKIDDQFGFSLVVMVLIIGIIIVLVVFFGLTGGKGLDFFKPASPVSKISTTILPKETAKQVLYEQNKEKIKADLNMTEEEFQILKRFSED